MKKTNTILLCTAVVSAALLCSSCGSKELDENNAQANDITQIQDNEFLSNGMAQTDDTGSVEDKDLAGGENTPGEEITAEPVAVVSIEIETEEEKDTAEDGTVIYERSYTKPIVTIAGNEEASEKINADIQSRIDDFMASEQSKNDAREYYEVTLKEEDFTFNEYSESLDFETVRADTNVISFIMVPYSYTGGAHGMYGNFGINYDARTGELISFDKLSDDAEKFYSDTLSYNQELAQTDEYKERMFEADFLGEDALENTLYADEQWYLSDEGLVFISNPYELGPYAAGIIEFVIPYDELSGMGLNEEYNLPN